jgi:hypothetical protein
MAENVKETEALLSSGKCLCSYDVYEQHTMSVPQISHRRYKLTDSIDSRLLSMLTLRCFTVLSVTAKASTLNSCEPLFTANLIWVDSVLALRLMRVLPGAVLHKVAGMCCASY